MGKKRAIRDFLIILLAIIGVSFLTFGVTLIDNFIQKTTIIATGVIFILISIVISLTKLLIR